MDTGSQKYRAFVEAARLGSFTKAAERLSYSQSGISRMIADLEREWGVTLLERGRGGVRPTSDGARLLPHARSLCDEFDRLRMEVDSLGGLASGTIRIGTFSSVATHWIPKIIKGFQADYPNIEYELLLGDYTEIRTWIADGRVDCGFLCLPADPELETIFLEDDELMAVLPQDHPLAGEARFPVQALADYPFMALAKGEDDVVGGVFERNGIPLHAQLTTWDDYAIMSMVESGLGISILPSLILRRSPYRLATMPLSPPAYRSIALALRSVDRASLATRKFLEYLDLRNS